MAVARRERILTMINSRGSVSLKELEHAFPEVSSMTLRRDLQYLDEQGLAIRVRRGARSAQNLRGTGDVEPVFTMRMVENMDAKERIAEAALPLIQSGRSLFLDAGTTINRLARALPDADFSIISHAPNIAMEISKRQRTSLFMLGGQLIKDNLSIVGEAAMHSLEPFNIDTAVMSASGYTPQSGFTCGNHDERSLKEAVIRKARRTILLMDSSKLGKSLPLTFARPADIDHLVIDIDRSDMYEQLLNDGLNIIRA